MQAKQGTSYVSYIQTNPGYYSEGVWVPTPWTTESVSTDVYYRLLPYIQYNGPKQKAAADSDVMLTNELAIHRETRVSKFATLKEKDFFPGHGPAVVTAADVPGNFQFLDNPEFTLPDFDSYADAVLTAAKQRALDKASEVVGNLSITLAEANETLNTIRQFIHRTSTAIVQIKRKHYAHAWRILVPGKVLPPRRPDGKRWGHDNSWINDYLGMRYGWMPLIKDAQDLAQLAAQRLASKPKQYTVRAARYFDGAGISAGYTAVPVVYDRRTTSRYVPTSGRVAKSRRTLYGSIRASAKLTVRVQCQAAQDLNQVLGNPLSVIWEKVPLSFIVDRYVAIGDYLRNLSALAGLQVLDGCAVLELQHNVADKFIDSDDYEVTTSVVGYTETTDYHRWPWFGSVPLHAGNVAINGHSVRQYVDEVALLAQRLVGGTTPRGIR